MDSGAVNYTHENWAETYTSKPQLYFKPRKVEDVQEIVRNAQKHNTKIVVVGAGHSPSAITMTEEWLVNLDNLNKVLVIDAKNGYSDVTVEVGMRLKDANDKLAAQGLALQNLGSISEQSIAGVISTGTHGASYLHGLISEQIVSLDIVTETGDIVTVSDNQKRDLFSAVLIGLGAFGIIVRAKLRCVAAYNVESWAYVMKFEELLTPEVWNSVFLKSEYHRIWWYPYTDRVFIWHGSRTPKGVKKSIGARKTYSNEPWLLKTAHELMLYKAVKYRPQLTPYVEKWLFKRQFDENKVKMSLGRNDREINMDCMYKQYVDEWSLPLNNGPELLKELRAEILLKKWFVHAPIEIRASNTTLPLRNLLQKVGAGPIYGNITRPLLDPSPMLEYKEPGEITNSQLTLNLNATMFRPFGTDPEYKEWFDFFDAKCSAYGGKPHWAKNFALNPWTRAENNENVRKWKHMRGMWDPNGIFGAQKWLDSKGLL